MAFADRTEEKRQSKRLKKALFAKVQFRTADGESFWDMVTIQDVSAGGMLFKYATAVELGTILDFQIHLPTADRELEGVARIVRNGAQQDGNFHRVAASFTQISSEDVDLIRQAVETLVV